MTSHERGRGERPHPKTLQFCAQVEEALAFALGDSHDPVLADLVLDAVEPLHGDGHLLVRFADPTGHGTVAALAAIERARGYLRAAVATGIARRRVPELSFTVLPGGAR